MTASPLAPVALRTPPIVLRSVMVDDDDTDLELTFERTPDGTHCAVEVTGSAITQVDTLVGRPGASLVLRDTRTLYALRDVLGVLITEAEAAGLLTPAWAAAEGDG